MMFDTIAQLFPAQWQGGVLLLLTPLRWLADWQPTMIQALIGGHPAGRLFMWVVLLVPGRVLMAGMWCTALSLYTIPSRSARGNFITSVMMAWWACGRWIWLCWTGMVRGGIASVGCD